MKQTARAKSFRLFLDHFSKETLPVTLSDDNIGYFDRKNRPLGHDVIRQFILQKTTETDDEDMTEYIACLVIPDTKVFHAVVYWRGSLLEYDYILATYNKDGILIQRKVIAGVRSDGHIVMRSVATIDADWIINIVTGAQTDEDAYNPKNSRILSLELMANGSIISDLDE